MGRPCNLMYTMLKSGSLSLSLSFALPLLPLNQPKRGLPCLLHHWQSGIGHWSNGLSQFKLLAKWDDGLGKDRANNGIVIHPLKKWVPWCKDDDNNYNDTSRTSQLFEVSYMDLLPSLNSVKSGILNNKSWFKNNWVRLKELLTVVPGHIPTEIIQSEPLRHSRLGTPFICEIKGPLWPLVWIKMSPCFRRRNGSI